VWPDAAPIWKSAIEGANSPGAVRWSAGLGAFMPRGRILMATGRTMQFAEYSPRTAAILWMSPNRGRRGMLAMVVSNLQAPRRYARVHPYRA